jgi:predicted dehydrogenase
MKIIQVGYGYWGESWMQFIADDPDTELAALVVRNGEKLRLAKEKWNLSDDQCFTDYDQALAVEADLVLIVLPHCEHIPFARRAVLAGKDVLIEKPLCDDFQEAKDFWRWMAGRKERVFVSQNYRYRQELWQMRRGFSGEELGALQFIQLTYRAGMTTDTREHEWNIQGWRGRQVNMLCYEVCIHHFDMLRFLVGADVRRVYCTGWTPAWGLTDGPESIFVNLEFENGVNAQIAAHGCSVGAPTGFFGNWQVQGAKGLLCWTAGEGLVLHPAADHPGTIPDAESCGLPGFDRAGVLRELHRAMAGESSTLPDLGDHLRSLAISEAVLRSTRERRVVGMAELLQD